MRWTSDMGMSRYPDNMGGYHGDEDWVDDDRTEEEVFIDDLEAEGYIIRGHIGKLFFVTTPLGNRTVKMLGGI